MTSYVKGNPNHLSYMTSYVKGNPNHMTYDLPYFRDLTPIESYFSTPFEGDWIKKEVIFSVTFSLLTKWDSGQMQTVAKLS